MMEWVDGFSLLQLGLAWIAASAVLGLLVGRLAIDPTPEMPILRPRPELDFSRFESAMAQLRGQLDDLQEFALSPPGIGREELLRLGGALDDGSLTAGRGRRPMSPPTSHETELES